MVAQVFRWAGSIAFVSVLSAAASEQILRPYISPRGAGMGGLKLTTGLYEENFFGNPARASFNSKTRVQLPDPMVETTLPTLTNLSTLLSSPGLSSLANSVGSNIHARFQLTFPGVYFSAGRTNIAFAVLTAAQVDFLVERAYQFTPSLLVDVGPALTVAHKFGTDERLTLGATVHFRYRMTSTEPYTFAQAIQAATPFTRRGEGAMVDFDLGATYRPDWKPFGWQFLLSGVMSNGLGGSYSMIPLRLFGSTTDPTPQGRTFGFGLGLRSESLWIFEKPVFGLEFQNLQLPAVGSFFRTIHLGTEQRWRSLAFRLGFYQGYFSAGLGLNLGGFVLDLATYGEEQALNTGGLESRNFAVRFNLRI